MQWWGQKRKVNRMYTVLRLCFRDEHRGLLPSIAHKLNGILPNCCSGEDRQPLRMSCTLAMEGSWDMHLQQVQKCLQAITAVLRENVDAFASTEVDVLIEPEDWSEAAYDDYRICADFLRILADNRIALNLTVSRPMASPQAGQVHTESPS